VKPLDTRESPCSDREAEGDACAALAPVLGPDAAAVRLDQTLGDREAESRVLARGARRVVTPEALEHALQRLRRETVAVVLDDDAHLFVACFGADANRAAGRGEAKGVRQQVRDDPSDLIGSAADPRHRRVEVGVERNVSCDCRDLDRPQAPVDHLVE
jgi:xanthine/CO dehydrogenase XdhC/CoxF family maturation factor